MWSNNKSRTQPDVPHLGKYALCPFPGFALGVHAPLPKQPWSISHRSTKWLLCIYQTASNNLTLPNQKKYLLTLLLTCLVPHIRLLFCTKPRVYSPRWHILHRSWHLESTKRYSVGQWRLWFLIILLSIWTKWYTQASLVQIVQMLIW